MDNETKKDLIHWGMAILLIWIFSLIPAKIRAVIFILGAGYLLGFWIYVLFIHSH